ncbi:tRNA 2'-phosphotransferase [Aspergillus clavatus NRRL 1]|uniref:2'-phosphotransferase n=1 Tax=Aspergillus clavatus (strain ATCC 1007 / CBS 513.65 / DSM 816 / NCTC 3887 / NRRL 1 / QM 1276 / 107) TaxID=344612 RepID=A1CF45_ASPCL|nr:tRNA splicing 2' phosphotransferase 1 [Aspergillus clavatus NRRL 1]EAW11494.1 tRNA splicing 2' phosphotransferase 1 [Aspergillus clavatus NRRL 1]
MSQNQRRGRGGNQSREVSISKALSLLLRHAAEKEGLKLDSQGYANMADVLAWKKLKSLKVTFAEIIHAVASSDKKRFALLHIPSAKASSTTDDATTPSSAQDTEAATASETEPSSMGSSQVPTTSADEETATAAALAVEDTDPSHFLIRATQGHSIKSVEAAAFLEKLTLEDEFKLPETVVHGTYHAAWPAILNSGGLRCMGRNQVHFATGPPLESVLPKHVDGMSHTAAPPGGLNDGRVISGMRRDAQVLVYIDIKKALAAGCPFWRSENGVILSEGVALGDGKDAGDGTAQKIVPLEFFDVVVERKCGLGKLWEHGEKVQELPLELVQKGNPKGPRTGPKGGRDGRTRG